MDRIGEITLGIVFFLWLTLLTILSFSDSNAEEKKIWKEMIEHSDDFTYSHISPDGKRVCFKLFDNDGKYLCEAVLYLDDECTYINRSTSIVLSRYSSEKLSKKMFKCLYPKIPENDLNKFVSNDELFNRIKKMK